MLLVHPGADPDEMPTTVPEGHILSAVLLALGARPDLGKFHRRNSGSGFPPGSPNRLVQFGDFPGGADVTGFLKGGRRCEIEVKTTSGRQRPNQAAFQRVCEEYGVLYLLVRSAEEAVAGVEAALAGQRRSFQTVAAADPECYTPPAVLERLGLTFDLDPCSPPGGLPWIPAEATYSLPADGLALPWRGRVWLNPPYGKETGRWLAHLAHHYSSGGGTGVALVFARPDTAWFQAAQATATAWVFPPGRLTFVDAQGEPVRRDKNGRGTPANCGSVLFAWGEEEARALEAFGQVQWRSERRARIANM